MCAQELTKKILKALAQTGQRAIILSGWGKLGAIDGHPMPPNVLVVDAVPHEYLLPRCAAVVHHGVHHRMRTFCTVIGLSMGIPLAHFVLIAFVKELLLCALS